MSLPKYTPGPWGTADNRHLNDAIWITVPHEYWGELSHAEVHEEFIIVRPGCDEAEEMGDMEANAKLIAAAPNLVLALIGMLEGTEPPEEGRRVCNVIRMPSDQACKDAFAALKLAGILK